MRQNIRFRWNVFGFGLIILVAAVLPVYLKKNASHYNWQKTVDEMRSLLAKHEHHRSSAQFQREIESIEPLDVNEYFKILTHIRMARGYDLDYVYAKGGLGSEPILYARKSTEHRLTTIKDLANYAGRHIRWPHKYYDYLEKVEVKGTLEGYFELVVLRIMGGQFYLTWHCLYNDKTVICDRKKLPEFWKTATDPIPDEAIPPEVREEAEKLDFSPRVDVLDDTVVVKVVVFTKWGGFFREEYHLSRASPHKIKKIEKEKLVPYDCGCCF